MQRTPTARTALPAEPQDPIVCDEKDSSLNSSSSSSVEDAATPSSSTPPPKKRGGRPKGSKNRPELGGGPQRNTPVTKHSFWRPFADAVVQLIRERGPLSAQAIVSACWQWPGWPSNLTVNILAYCSQKERLVFRSGRWHRPKLAPPPDPPREEQPKNGNHGCKDPDQMNRVRSARKGRKVEEDFE